MNKIQTLHPRNCLIECDSQGSPGVRETQRGGVSIGPRGLPKGRAPRTRQSGKAGGETFQVESTAWVETGFVEQRGMEGELQAIWHG